MISFYCGLGSTTWNLHPVEPGPLACISPLRGNDRKHIVGVHVPDGVQVLQDSGAFSDNLWQRLHFAAALARQERHAARYDYAHKIAYRASYDLLVDEKWSGGVRYKSRWSEEEAWSAIDETVRSAEFLNKHRNGYPLALSAQGVSPRQYLICVERILPCMRDGDLFALGGWCITGKYAKTMLPIFSDTVRLVIPFLAREGVKSVHVWGVCYAPALAQMLYLCTHYGLALSIDSAVPCYAPCRGKFGYAEWRDLLYVRPKVQSSCREQRFEECDRCMGLERVRHVRMTRSWLESFENTPTYCNYIKRYSTR